jgi:hypothetical protein
MWPTAILVLFSAAPCCGPRYCVHAEPSQPTRDSDSANFHVESYAVGYGASDIARCCESWRKQLAAQWLGAEEPAAWEPRCTVIVHASRQTYRAAIGRGGEQSFGSSWIDIQNGRIRGRRVDLLVDSRGAISALGHELTHLVIADAFPGQQPPPWANEGAALLADSAEKQRLHRRDLSRSLQLQTGFHSAELLQLTTYPQPQRIAAFYAQSGSLAAFLAEIGGPEKFIPFVKLGSQRGYDHALQTCYGISSVAELHRQWDAHARTSGWAEAPSE